MFGYSIHKERTKKYYPIYEKISFKEFIEKFNKVNWYIHAKFPQSLFSDVDKFALHASIYVFNQNAYIAKNPIDFFMIKRFIKKYIKKNLNKLEIKYSFE